MQIGVIGLGRMGGNMSRRLMKAGHTCVVFDANAMSREALAKDGATAARSLEGVVKAMTQKPRAIWLMLPPGRITEETVEHLGGLLEADDIIIDGGNSFYKDDIRRAKKLVDRRIRYVDCGTSGGVWGIERGYCMMIGGPKEAVDHLDPILSALAPGLGDIPRTSGREKGDARFAPRLGITKLSNDGRPLIRHRDVEYAQLNALRALPAINRKRSRHMQRLSAMLDKRITEFLSD